MQSVGEVIFQVLFANQKRAFARDYWSRQHDVIPLRHVA